MKKIIAIFFLFVVGLFSQDPRINIIARDSSDLAFYLSQASSNSSKKFIVTIIDSIAWSGTIPSNVIIAFSYEGKLANNSTIIWNGGLVQTNRHIFYGNNIDFSNSKIFTYIPEWFGAIGDGNTDDYNALNKVFSYTPEGRVIKLLPGKTYKISGSNSLNRTKSVVIIGSGATILCNDITSHSVLSFTGGFYTDWYSIPNGYNAGDTTITVPSSISDSCSAGDIIWISSAIANGATVNVPNTWLTASYKGEYAQVEEVVGTTLHLSNPLYEDYGANDSTVVVVMDMPKIFMSNLTLLNDDPSDFKGGLVLTRCKNVAIEDIKTHGFGWGGILPNQCFGGYISDCATEVAYKSGHGLGLNYGVSIIAQNFKVINCDLRSGRHGLDVSGSTAFQSRNVLVSGCTIGNYPSAIGGIALSTHPECRNVVFNNNIVYGAAYIRSDDTILRNNSFYGKISYGVTIALQPAISHESIMIEGNIFNGTMQDGFILNNTSYDTLQKLIVFDNKFLDAEYAFRFTTDINLKTFIFNNNFVNLRQNSFNSIALLGSSTKHCKLGDVLIADNIIYANGNYNGFRCYKDTISTLQILNNKLYEAEGVLSTATTSNNSIAHLVIEGNKIDMRDGNHAIINYLDTTVVNFVVRDNVCFGYTYTGDAYSLHADSLYIKDNLFFSSIPVGTNTRYSLTGFNKWYRMSNGSPIGSLTPVLIGETVLDTANSAWYISYGTADTSWSKITP